MVQLSVDELRDLFSRFALTEGMTALAIDRLSRIASLRSYAAGQILFRESEPHHRLYWIRSGSVSLQMRIPGQCSQKILTVGPGEWLAWSDLLHGSPMTASAITEAATELVEFETGPLKSLCDEEPQVGYYFMRQIAMALSKRLLATRLQLLDLFRS